jgi:hypothetical protein
MYRVQGYDKNVNDIVPESERSQNFDNPNKKVSAYIDT